jgi:hypothetical protein
MILGGTPRVSTPDAPGDTDHDKDRERSEGNRHDPPGGA